MDLTKPRNSFEKAKVNYQSLTDYDSLITLAVEKDIVTEQDLKTLLNWRSDPANWNAKS